jgi:hypothetical protein
MVTDNPKLNIPRGRGAVPSNQPPAAKWRENGESDPHGDYYNGERAMLCNGHMTDDELANEVFLSPGIANLTAAKERIRWLSRALVASGERVDELEQIWAGNIRRLEAADEMKEAAVYLCAVSDTKDPVFKLAVEKFQAALASKPK